jgi:hypothetical protein
LDPDRPLYRANLRALEAALANGEAADERR